MGILVAILISLLVVVAAPFVNAQISPAIAVGNAKTVVELRDKVLAATAALRASTTEAEKVKLIAALGEAQKELDLAVKSIYSGTTEEGIKRAEQIIQKQKLVDDLRVMLSKPGLEASQESTLRQALTAAQSDANNSAAEVSDTKRLKELADKRFAEFNLGVALGVVIKAGKRDLVQSASLDANRIVRIDRDNNTTANLILEAHYFFTPELPMPISSM